MSGLNEIWKDSKGRVPEEQLLAYLSGKLSAEEQHEIERLLSEENMESDAVEGLKALSAENTERSVHKLNQQLHQLTYKRKRRTLSLTDHKWGWLAILVILLLGVLGYFVLYVMAQ